jgi:hypothetical protein
MVTKPERVVFIDTSELDRTGRSRLFAEDLRRTAET